MSVELCVLHKYLCSVTEQILLFKRKYDIIQNVEKNNNNVPNIATVFED